MLETTETKSIAPSLAPLSESVLISFPICPFVARARVVALEKGIDIRIKFIDLLNKPAWFLDRSPTGTVPALDTGEHFIFESSVISEFIDECTDGSLHPGSAADRAVNRAWTEYAAKLLMPQYFLLMASSQAEIEKHRLTLIAAMQKVEEVLASKPYFNGDVFSIIDAAYAPVFVRTRFLLETYKIDVLSDLPKLQAWGQALTDRPSVINVHGPEHYEQLKEHMIERGSILTSRKI